jgi:hypothetical protein
MPTEVRTPDDLKPGEIYEDCARHPCLCLCAEDEDEVRSVSLVDGSYPRSCSIGHCGVRKLTVEEARRWKESGPEGVELEPGHRWWETTL